MVASNGDPSSGSPHPALAAASGGRVLVIGPPPLEAAAVVILLHGRHRSPAEMRHLADALELPRFRFVMPEAPGGVWYPERFFDPIAANEPELSRSLARCEAMVSELMASGLPAERIVLGGFSQGACITAEMLVRHPRRYGAAVIWTGGLMGPPGTAWPQPPELAEVPVYLSGSMIDDWVWPRRVEETGRVLAAAGAAVQLRMFVDRKHIVSDAELAETRAMLMGIGP